MFVSSARHLFCLEWPLSPELQDSDGPGNIKSFLCFAGDPLNLKVVPQRSLLGLVGFSWDAPALYL